MTTKKVLKGAIAFLKKGWTKGTWARNAAGRRCSPTSKHAIAWCAEGATIAASAGDDVAQFHAWSAFHDAVGIDAYDNAAKWNDEQESVKPVIAAMKRALRKRP